VIVFQICDNAGAAYFSVPKSDMTVTPGGTSGAYTVTIDVPVTEAQSRLVDVGNGTRKYQLYFGTNAGYQDIVEDGRVPVYTPFAPLP
jgi:hypothetical protein